MSVADTLLEEWFDSLSPEHQRIVCALDPGLMTLLPSDHQIVRQIIADNPYPAGYTSVAPSLKTEAIRAERYAESIAHLALRHQVKS